MSADAPKPSVSHTDLADELEALVRARQELSRDEERFLIETFLSRLDSEIDARIVAKVGTRAARKSVDPVAVLALALVFAVPLSAIAGKVAGLTGLFVAWAAIVVVVFVTTHGSGER